MTIKEEFYFRYNYLNHPDKRTRKKYKKGWLKVDTEPMIYKATKITQTQYKISWFNSNHANVKYNAEDVISWLERGYWEMVDKSMYISEGNMYIHRMNQKYGHGI